MLGLLVVVYKIPYSSCIFDITVVACVILFTHGFSYLLMVSPDVVDIGFAYFVYLSCVYIYRLYICVCSAGYAELPVLLNLLQRLVYHMLSKTRRSFGDLHSDR